MDNELKAAARCYYFMQGYLGYAVDHGNEEAKKALEAMENHYNECKVLLDRYEFPY